MRFTTLIALVFVTSLASGLAPADETAQDTGLLAGIKAEAEPLLYALGLLGTPYRLGGTNPDEGVDCSGFVRHVYKNTAGIELPRSARQISDKGHKIDKEALKPGDLVFFNTLKKPFSHVGIYAGDGKFVHSSSSRSKRVMLSDMQESYWAKRYQGARRILSP